jgi:N-formylglutamate amidohydrolase
VPASLSEQFYVSPNHLWRELWRLTDWYTDELFVCPEAASTVIAPVNRQVVDVERYLDDAKEIMAKVGQGVIYSQDCQGERLRYELNTRQREHLIDCYYLSHHSQLHQVVQGALEQHGRCLLIDCHSFPSMAFPYEKVSDKLRPDICLGTDPVHTPIGLIEVIKNFFESQGLSVAINSPYSGCLVPEICYGTKKLMAIMIEINRAQYIDEQMIDDGAVYWCGDRLNGPLPAKRAGFSRMKSMLDELIYKLRGEFSTSEAAQHSIIESGINV